MMMKCKGRIDELLNQENEDEPIIISEDENQEYEENSISEEESETEDDEESYDESVKTTNVKINTALRHLTTSNNPNPLEHMGKTE